MIKRVLWYSFWGGGLFDLALEFTRGERGDGDCVNVGCMSAIWAVIYVDFVDTSSRWMLTSLYTSWAWIDFVMKLF